MASLNKVMLIGNLTRDPEIRYTPKGNAVADVAIAINRRYRVEDEVREETTYVDITFWGRQAETAAQYLKKGRPIFVEGRLQLDSWEDKNTGQKRSRLRVVGDGFQFLGGRDDDGPRGGGDERRGGGVRQASDDEAPARGGGYGGEGGGNDFDDDDEIPF